MESRFVVLPHVGNAVETVVKIDSVEMISAARGPSMKVEVNVRIARAMVALFLTAVQVIQFSSQRSNVWAFASTVVAI